MENNWKEYRLDEIGEIIGGATPSTKNPDLWDGNIPWISPKDLSGYTGGRYISRGERNITELGYKSCSTQKLPKGTVLFSSRAPIGYVAIAENEVCTNQGFKSVIPNKKTASLFLYYLLIYNKDNIEHLGSGTTFKEVSGSVMRSVKVKVPSLQIQNKIASILSSIDDKIELNNKMNTNLEEEILTTYKAFFIDFQQNEGVIPSDWKYVLLSDILLINKRGLSPKYADSGIPVINQRCIRNGVIIEEAIQYHDYNAKYYSEVEYLPYDVLINSMGVGTLGRVSQVGDLRKRYLIHSCVSILRANGFYNQLLLGAHMKCIESEIELMGQGTTGQTSLSNKELGKKLIPIPPKKFQDEIGSLFKAKIDLITANLLENKKLAELRDALLPKLMSGEIDVEDLDL